MSSQPQQEKGARFAHTWSRGDVSVIRDPEIEGVLLGVKFVEEELWKHVSWPVAEALALELLLRVDQHKRGDVLPKPTKDVQREIDLARTRALVSGMAGVGDE